MTFNYRNDVYAFFDTRPGGIIGVAAFKPAPFYSIVEEYLDKQNSLTKTYGYDTLRNLVDDDIGKRFDSALSKLKIAIRRCNEDKTQWTELKQRVEICKRGLDAMENYVKANNLFTMPTVWVSKRGDGNIVGIVENHEDVATVKNIRTDLTLVWSVDELMEVIDRHKQTNAVKSRLEELGLESKIVSMDQPNDEEYFDEPIPF